MTTLSTTLFTPRLKLRPFTAGDAQRVAMFVGDWDVARMLAVVPHPYSEADALKWIAGGESPRWAIVHANGVIGAISAATNAQGQRLLGYWLGKAFWGRGLMTEAAACVVAAVRLADPSVDVLVDHFEDNPGSARVIAKLGFISTGRRQMACLARNTEVTCLTYSLPLDAARVRAPVRSGAVLIPA